MAKKVKKSLTLENTCDTLEYTVNIEMIRKVSTNSIYSGVHWSKRREIANLYHTLVLTLKKKLPKIQKFPVILHFICEFEGRVLDSFNCVYMCKCIEDGLVRAGMLPDDSPKYVKYAYCEPRKGEKDLIILKVRA